MLPLLPALALQVEQPRLIIPDRPRLIVPAQPRVIGPNDGPVIDPMLAAGALPNFWPLSFMGRQRTSTTDPHFASTVLLVGPVDAVGADNVTDESFAANGLGTSVGGGNNAVVENTNTLFGSPTMRFDAGFNDFFSWSDSTNWTFGNGLVTIEGFVMLSTANVAATLMAHWNSSSQRAWQIQYAGNLGTPTLSFIGSSDGTATSTIVGGNFTMTAASWYYFCYERAASNVHRLYAGPLGGTASMLDKQTNSITLKDSTTGLTLSGTANAASCINGNLAEIRITKGVARYATDAGFAVPTAKFPRS